MIKIIGRKPVLEALKSNQQLEKIFLLYGSSGEIINQIIGLARSRGIKVVESSSEKFNLVAGKTVHQGVAAVKSSIDYKSLEEIIQHSKKFTYPLLVILDSIQDPHNLGAIIRTCEGAGVHGIIITKHNSASINETVEKTSAGAVSHMLIHQAGNINHVIKNLKANDFWIVGAALENSKNYCEVDYKCPVALVLGNEEKGIRRLVAENCDFVVKIPMQGKIQSLNVSVSTGVILYEILRQRNQN